MSEKPDLFAKQRREVRQLQHLLASAEKAAAKTQNILIERCARGEISHTLYGAWCDQLWAKIHMLEYEIIRRKQRLPPFAEELDNGSVRVFPVQEPIDPRAPL